jgi:hypothetical protein
MFYGISDIDIPLLSLLIKLFLNKLALAFIRIYFNLRASFLFFLLDMFL